MEKDLRANRFRFKYSALALLPMGVLLGGGDGLTGPTRLLAGEGTRIHKVKEPYADPYSCRRWNESFIYPYSCNSLHRCSIFVFLLICDVVCKS